MASGQGKASDGQKAKERTRNASQSNGIDVPNHLACPICFLVLEVEWPPSIVHALQEPRRVPCGVHTCCRECVEAWAQQCRWKGVKPRCPMCQEGFEEGHVERDEGVEAKLEEEEVPCGCGERVKGTRARQHARECAECSDDGEAPVKKSQCGPSSPQPRAPRRGRYACPACGREEVRAADLREHVKREHGSRKMAGVCPVCAAMPWGDPQYASADVLGHILARHRFDYEEGFVDISLSEDEQLRQAISRSLSE